MEKHDHVTPLFGAALVPHNHRAHVLASEREILYLRYFLCNVTAMKQVFQSVMFQRLHGVEKMWWYRQKMSYQGNNPECDGPIQIPTTLLEFRFRVMV